MAPLLALVPDAAYGGVEVRCEEVPVPVGHFTG